MRILKSGKLFFVYLVLLIVPFTTLAAGGGGGGGGSSVPPPPPCSSDTWTCSDWSTCELSGNQSRVCELTFDCPTANTPKPPTTQTCTPSCTEDFYSCTEWTRCDARGEQHRTCGKTADCPLVDTPKPIEVQRCQPSCTKDVWTCTGYGPCNNARQTRICSLSFDCPNAATPKPIEAQGCVAPPHVAPQSNCTKDIYTCTDWSECNENGKETRNCAFTTDCPRVAMPQPEESRICPGLHCGQLMTLKERISCRLKLSNEELANEFKILYAPETCRSFSGAEEKLECIKLYQSLGPCWQISVGDARNACAKQIIGVHDIAQGKSECAQLKNNERIQCLDKLKDKVRYLILFRMYDLEVRAETLISRGIPAELVTELDTFIETQKQTMLQTNDTQEWKRLVQETQKRWREFINEVRKIIE